jgi:cytoskeletal protein CcmA (bactofilin family)
MRSSSAPSIISADLVVQGTLTSSGDIQIDGKVEGNVNSTGLVIGDKAFIEGDVMAEDVTVRGRVKGAIRARKVLLASTCHVEGDILHEAFAVETGAFFEGNCRHADNPLAQQEASRVVAPATQPMQPAPSMNVAPSQMSAPASVAAMPPRPADSAPRPSAATFAPIKTGS